MKLSVFGKALGAAPLILGSIVLTACGDDDSDFSPVSKNRGYDYALKSASEFQEYPCNEMREGRNAIVGRDKDNYVCTFDSRDSVYIWVGETDTLTAEGRKFERTESSSSVKDRSSSSQSSSSRSSSSYSSSSYSSSSSSYRSSSSRKFLEADSVISKDLILNPSIDYGTMTDPRDGQTYRTVVVNGLTWMAENLNYAGNEIGTSTCYGENDDNCKVYGRLYSRDAAMNSSRCAFGSPCDLGYDPIQGICPDGWHIVTQEEMQSVLDVASSESDLISAGPTWDYPGTDDFGLSFAGAGNWDEKDGWEDLHSYEVMWIYVPEIEQYYFLLSNRQSTSLIWNYADFEFLCSVRCIKDGGIIIPASSSSRSSSSYSSSSSSSSQSSSSNSSSSLSSSSSSKKKQYIEPLLEAAGDQFNPAIEYGTLTDTRDGKTYKTVEAAGTTWMAENLNYAGNEIGESVCFNEDDRFCELYGRFYSRDAAMNSEKCTFMSGCNLGSDPIQGICPDGWHIPTMKEAQDLVNLASGTSRSLRSAKGWDADISSGTDKYGLSFLGAGSYNDNEGFYSLGKYEHVWVYYASSYQYYIVIRGSSNESEVWDYGSHEVYNPVRCVKDE